MINLPAAPFHNLVYILVSVSFSSRAGGLASERAVLRCLGADEPFSGCRAALPPFFFLLRWEVAVASRGGGGADEEG